MPGDIYDKSGEFVELLESKLGVSGITLGSTWTDPLAAWGMVIDTSAGSVSEVVGNVQGRLLCFDVLRHKLVIIIYPTFSVCINGRLISYRLIGAKSKAEGEVTINGYLYKWMTTCSEVNHANR